MSGVETPHLDDAGPKYIWLDWRMLHAQYYLFTEHFWGLQVSDERGSQTPPRRHGPSQSGFD